MTILCNPDKNIEKKVLTSLFSVLLLKMPVLKAGYFADAKNKEYTERKE